MKRTTARSNSFYFILLFIISFAFRLALLLIFKFDGLYGQDAYAYYNYSKEFYLSLASFQVPPNFYWPIGYYLVTSVFTVFTIGNTDLAGLIVSLSAGSLVSGFTYLLSYELLSDFLSEQRKRISLYAGLIAAFSPILVKSSIVIMSDALGLMFAVWSMQLLVKYIHNSRPVHIIFSFVLLSLAVMTRYIFVLLLLLALFYMIYSIIGKKVNLRKAILHFFMAAVFGIIVFSPQLYYLSRYGIPYFGEGSWVSEWNILNFFRKDFTTLDGTIHYKLWNSLYNLSPVFHPMYLSIFGIGFIVGSYSLIKKKRYSILIFAVGWILPFYLYLSGNPYQSMRYTMSFLPALAFVSAFGFSILKIKKTFSDIIFYFGIIVFIFYNFYHINGFAEQKNKEMEIINWVNNNVSDGTTVFAFDITLAIDHYTKLSTIELYNCSENELKSRINSSEHDIYFILPVEKIQSQWKGLSLESKLKLILTQRAIQEISKINNFTVFKLPGKR